ncbi:MAG: helix-turn-helix transcriptional regulator [Campylobacterota bacterium]|nr:helix-turn-helix transcriptional regulator [Campylobacterota bacterium]
MYKNKPCFLHLLTEQERDIAYLVAEGFSDEEISQKRKIALSTVKKVVDYILEKAGLSDRVLLALKFN